MEFWTNGDKIVRSEIAGEYYDRFAKYRKNTLMKTIPDHDNAQLMWWVVIELKFILTICHTFWGGESTFNMAVQGSGEDENRVLKC